MSLSHGRNVQNMFLQETDIIPGRINGNENLNLPLAGTDSFRSIMLENLASFAKPNGRSNSKATIELEATKMAEFRDFERIEILLYGVLAFFWPIRL